MRCQKGGQRMALPHYAPYIQLIHYPKIVRT